MDHFIRVYRSTGKLLGGWRWTRTVENGNIVGASTEAYKKRDGATANLYMNCGINLINRCKGARWQARDFMVRIDIEEMMDGTHTITTVAHEYAVNIRGIRLVSPFPRG